MMMAKGSASAALAGTILLTLGHTVHAQGADKSTPPSTAQLSARAATDAGQALDRTADPNVQPAPGTDSVIGNGRSHAGGLYDHQSLVPERKNGLVDPNSIHYPYG